MDSLSRSMIGRQSRATGWYFEDMIIASAKYYEEQGISAIDKTPEPVKILSVHNRKFGQFVCCFAKQAQPDFKGVLADSTMVLFDAKHTDSGTLKRGVVTEEQEKCFNRYMKLGANCFLVVSLGFEKFYRVPWTTFRDMKEIYGRKYMKYEELDPFQIIYSNGVLRFLDGIELRERTDYESTES